MEYVGEETIIENENGQGEGWVETHHYDATTNELEDKVCEMTLDNNKNDDDDIAADMEDNNGEDDDGDEDDEGEAADMEDFEESGMLEMVDPVCILPVIPYEINANCTRNNIHFPSMHSHWIGNGNHTSQSRSKRNKIDRCVWSRPGDSYAYIWFTHNIRQILSNATTVGGGLRWKSATAERRTNVRGC